MVISTLKPLLLASIGALAIVFVSRGAHADTNTKETAETAAPPPSSPALHHAPRVTARTGEDMAIGANLDRPDRIKRALLVYTGTGASGEVEFARSSDADLPYVAIIPATAIRAPSLSYAIAAVTTGRK